MRSSNFSNYLLVLEIWLRWWRRPSIDPLDSICWTTVPHHTAKATSWTFVMRQGLRCCIITLIIFLHLFDFSKIETFQREVVLPVAQLWNLRLALLCVLRGVPHDMAVHVGLKCSSLCKMNQGTSMRSACASIGYFYFKSVWESNLLTERTLSYIWKGESHMIIDHQVFPIAARQNQTLLRSCLLILVATCMGAVWTLEQPSGSVLLFYPAFRYMMISLQQVGGPHAVHALPL